MAIEEQREIVKKYLHESDLTAIVYGFNDFIGHMTDFYRTELDHHDLAIGYSKEFDLYVVFNCYLHRFKENAASVTLSIRKGTLRKMAGELSAIMPIYKFIQGLPKKKQKILIITSAFLEEFCQDPFSYLRPNVGDMGYDPNTLFATYDHPEPALGSDILESEWLFSGERNRSNCTRIERDHRFRKLVLLSYGFKCAVCGMSARDVLEAAHIIAVKDGGADTEQNGVCLCANHHRLYDAGAFSIDIISGKIICQKSHLIGFLNWGYHNGSILRLM